MLTVNLLNALVFGLSAFLAAYAALTVLNRQCARRYQTRRGAGSDIFGDTLVFLIRDEKLVDCNFPGHRFLAASGSGDSDIANLRRALGVAFDAPDKLTTLSRDGADLTALSRDGMIQAIAEQAHGTLRLKVQNRAQAIPASEDIHRLAAQDAELETLRKTVETAPYLVWREAPDGTPIWVNRAWLDAARDLHGSDRLAQWPLPRLFPTLERGAPRRVPLAGATSAPRWFEAHSVPIGRDTLFTAYDANATVRAETQLHDFMQTLTKTFAQLTTGLAIFDKSRNLALFNPAMTELTRLPVEFLASRPSLFELLDRLREHRMIPEPRDYRLWRQRVAQLETQAANGTYEETWSLPGNITYRVTGRPHPDGAIAFLIEDISTEIAVTRQFRRELECSQSLLDNMEDATVLFSQAGTVQSCNRAYRRLWRHDPDSAVTDTTVMDATRLWHDACAPTPVWGDFRDFAEDPGERIEWTAPVSLRDGREVDCRFIPLAAGATQVIFRQTDIRSTPVEAQRLEAVG